MQPDTVSQHESMPACPQCGEIPSPGAMVCRGCGEDLDRPEWEQPGAVRRDCEPHRATFLVVLGYVGAVLSFFYLLGIIGLPLCISVMVMARADEKKMKAGRMDPEGLERTRLAGRCGLVGVIFTGAWIALHLALVWLYISQYRDS